MKRTKTIYYNEHGQVDKFTTYINNHAWVMPVWFIVSVLIVGLVEGM